MCGSINLEGHLHPRDVVVMHRSFDMLIGIHGAHLTDAIWMYHSKLVGTARNKYIVELLPTNGPSWTASTRMPTALGVIFRGSKLNHIGFKLHHDSITQKDWDRGDSRWYKSDFKVRWERLKDVIDFALIDDGGYCRKYNHIESDIKLPRSFKDKEYVFAIYNAFCNTEQSRHEDLPWHFAYTARRDSHGSCTTCSDLTFEDG